MTKTRAHVYQNMNKNKTKSVRACTPFGTVTTIGSVLFVEQIEIGREREQTSEILLINVFDWPFTK